MAEIAGYLLVAIGAAHMMFALVWVDRGAVRRWRRVPTPWAARAVELRSQRDFWSQVGSFGVPVALLGGLVVARVEEPPWWIGSALLAWTAVAIVRVPRGGFWVLLVPALLLLVDAVD